MNKSELVEAIADGSDVTKATASKVLDCFMENVTKALKNGDEVALTGFGTWVVGNRAARKGRNPQTGAEIQIQASRVAKFKAGKKLKEEVQRG